MQWMGMPCCSKVLKIPTCAMPRANPPLSANPIRGGTIDVRRSARRSVRREFRANADLRLSGGRVVFMTPPRIREPGKLCSMRDHSAAICSPRGLGSDLESGCFATVRCQSRWESLWHREVEKRPLSRSDPRRDLTRTAAPGSDRSGSRGARGSALRPPTRC
jgi:hypothetical protein